MLSSGYGVNDKKSKYYLNVITDSIDELIEVIGNEVTLEIPNEFVITGLSLESINKNFDNKNSVCSITLSLYPYEEVLSEQAEDIEVISQAIEEIGEIIDDIKEGDIEVISQAIAELAELVANKELEEAQ